MKKTYWILKCTKNIVQAEYKIEGFQMTMKYNAAIEAVMKAKKMSKQEAMKFVDAIPHI